MAHTRSIIFLHVPCVRALRGKQRQSPQGVWLTRGDICFLIGSNYITSTALSSFADRVEVRFRASTGNHAPSVVSGVTTGATRSRIDWNWTGPKSGDGGQPGVGAFEVLLELMDICTDLDEHAPIAAYPHEDRWKVRTEKETTLALRAIISRQGLDPSEYAYIRVALAAPRVWQRWGCRT